MCVLFAQKRALQLRVNGGAALWATIRAMLKRRLAWLGWLARVLGVTFSTAARPLAISTRVPTLEARRIMITRLTNPEIKDERNLKRQVKRRKTKEDKIFPRNVTEIFPAPFCPGDAGVSIPYPHIPMEERGYLLGTGGRSRHFCT